jgi:hypothetical protein
MQCLISREPFLMQPGCILSFPLLTSLVALPFPAGRFLLALALEALILERLLTCPLLVITPASQ